MIYVFILLRYVQTDQKCYQWSTQLVLTCTVVFQLINPDHVYRKGSVRFSFNNGYCSASSHQMMQQPRSQALSSDAPASLRKRLGTRLMMQIYGNVVYYGHVAMQHINVNWSQKKVL